MDALNKLNSVLAESEVSEIATEDAVMVIHKQALRVNEALSELRNLVDETTEEVVSEEDAGKLREVIKMFSEFSDNIDFKYDQSKEA